MDNVALTIVFYSATGVNYQMARWAAKAAEAAGAQVRMVKVRELAPQEAIRSNPAWEATVKAMEDVPEATSQDLDWADAILFSSPTRFGNLSAQMKQFLDQQGGLWAKGKLANKAISAMASAQNPHGGQEGTVKALYTTMMHWGAIIVPPGYTDASIVKAGGNPYGTSVTQGADGTMKEDVKDAVEYQTKRLVEVARWLKKGKA